MYIVCTVPCGLSAVVLVGFFFQAEDGIRDLVRSRGLGDVYKRQPRRRLKGASGSQASSSGTSKVADAPVASASGMPLSLIHI